MNVFAKFDEIPSITLQDIKETKRHGHTFVRWIVRTDNVKTVYPPTNTVCGGYNDWCIFSGCGSFTKLLVLLKVRFYNIGQKLPIPIWRYF